MATPLADPSLYINRELSWLRFNTRVLKESQKESLPLLERLKFLAIYATNLDEFYMIRVAGLRELFAAGVVVTGADEQTPLDQLREIRRYLDEEKTILEDSFKTIIKGLEEQNLHIRYYNDLDPANKIKADEFFFSNILPVIVPIAVDATHPFPHLNNLSFSVAVKLQDKDRPDINKYGMIRIPRVLPRFYQAGDNIYVPIESIVHEHAEEIFPGYQLISSAPFRVTRNADIVIEEEEADDFMMILEQGLKMRRKGAFVRLQVEKDSDPDIIEFLNSHMKIFHKDIYAYDIPLNLPALWQIVGNKDFSYLCLPPNSPKILPPFSSGEPILDIIERGGDALLFHPYESFDPITRMIKEAAKDPKVISIRMTLYRVEQRSQIIQALIDAASEGKQITVMVELKARFDEENNLHWAKALENAGAHVIYGITGFKVHAKVTQIIRQVDGKLKFYMHFGTGNYNASTAKIYTDASFFTCKEEFAKDSTAFFHILSGFSKNRKLNTLSMSPMQIKNRIISMINNESTKGAEGHIIAKMNSLVDPDVIKALYYASSQGVKIQLIVRGICCLRPGVEGVSDTIEVKSIIGKYLEHARIFYFKNSDPQMYISSADWMPRNLERRLELMTPIIEQSLVQKLYEILQLQLNDNQLSWILGADGEYTKLQLDNDTKPINNHQVLEDYINRIYKTIKKDATSSKVNQLSRKLFKES